MKTRRSWLVDAACVVVLLLHAGGAVTWLLLTPGGFPIWHRRFGLNTLAPVVLLLAVVAGLVGVLSAHQSLRRLLIAFPTFWLVASLVAWALFPLSLRSGPAVALLVTTLVAWGLRSSLATVPPSRGSTVSAVLCGLVLGAFVPWALRAPNADTRPSNGAPRTGDTAELTLHASTLELQISPLLRFRSVSPDRSWSLLSPVSPPTLPALAAVDWQGPNLRIEATAFLEQPVYSHLNSFTELTVSGHRRLSIAFSPAPSARIEVTPMDYPAGRPERFAYVDQDERFHVVEATSGEKGPFFELALGPLAHRGALELTLYDEARPIWRLTFEDWAAQSSTSLSPTAGWGVPQNAIEFCLLGDSPSSTARIFFTLAGTSVGRGWDTVGHTAGTYRNRIQVKPLVP